MTRDSDSSYRILAARSLRKQIKQLGEHLGGIRRGDDIESIHRARVASRRLRAALGMFRVCWKRKPVKHWKKQIRQLAQNLGEARDHDVLIEYLASRLAGVSDQELVPGIAFLLNHMECQRKWIQPRVLKAVDRFDSSDVLKIMHAAASLVFKEAVGGEFVAGECARGPAAKSVSKRLRRLLEDAQGLAAPEHHERHHTMRIAAKRLRYTLELAKPVLAGEFAGSDLAETMEAVKKLQSLLGEIHDCDVWVETFAEFAQKKSGEIPLYFGSLQQFERFRSGLDYLRQERTGRRNQVFSELASYWRALRERGVWDRLSTILERNTRSNPSASSIAAHSTLTDVPQMKVKAKGTV